MLEELLEDAGNSYLAAVAAALPGVDVNDANVVERSEGVEEGMAALFWL
jgi:hypothetical protein